MAKFSGFGHFINVHFSKRAVDFLKKGRFTRRCCKTRFFKKILAA
uniref:Uncharacterized protein n=1 Tax=viral metagenome TaxID=1070528 RepID=A0A6C0JMJ6_9ZZZZ